jgi:hypothetical protein
MKDDVGRLESFEGFGVAEAWRETRKSSERIHWKREQTLQNKH